MCGISGFFAPRGMVAVDAPQTLERMTCAVRHRGPDDSGSFVDAEVGIAIGHRRLSVIDLTAAGHQPQVSEAGRFVLAFNGEIYNHLDLRAQLGEWRWRGHSDTETLLVGIQQWGLEETLRRSNGMFAIALWDRAEQTLSLARDRMGEKPLYYGWQRGTLLFGSELKSLREHPDFAGELDRAAVGLYVRRGYVPAPKSIFAGISKLLPGTILRIERACGAGAELKPMPYWSLLDVVTSATNQRYDNGPDAAVSELERLLIGAIQRQQLSDVPLGAFLSGGVDSSLVVALMQTTASMPVKTYTIGFAESGYDEAPHARAVAKHLGTSHTELYVSPAEAMEVIPGLPFTYDEPFADLSQIPTMLVSRLARRDVTVALSGDGGDELFAGYDRYADVTSKWRKLSAIPTPVRRALARLMPQGRLSEGIGARSVDEIYQFLISQWKGVPGLVLGAPSPFASEPAPAVLRDPKERLMYADQTNYLPDDILVKVDRAAMSTSLETRVPMLDHRVVEFAWRLPIDIKSRNGIGKWPLKQILYKYVPQKIVDRPKMGFGVPMEHWLRGPLREWADDLLSEERLRREEVFDPAPIRQSWSEHLSGQHDRQYGLWTILMFQAWLETSRK